MAVFLDRIQSSSRTVNMMKFLSTVVAPIFIALLVLHCGPYVAGAGEWQVITKQNYSSQIRLHPHILLLVALPWSGECRSLMKDVVHLVADRKEEFGSLKLMFMHRNTEKMLADSIGATTDEITVFYFHYSIPYKYRGRLQAKKLMSSLYPYISVSPEEVPLKALRTPEELRVFLDSTDTALVLMDFCGWTPKLLAKSKKNGTENGFSSHGDDLMGFSGESDTILISSVKNNLKDMCKAENTVSKWFTEVPWLGGFNIMNDTGLEGTKDMDDVLSCNFEEFQRFHSFYRKFLTVVREFFLPPERHRFGLVLERSMLSSLGVKDSGSWSAVKYLAGCPSCSKILKEEDDLNYVLQMDDNFVKELEGHGHDQEPILQANKPSIILFVDKSSDSLEIKEKSNKALDAFREFALDYHVVNEIGKKDYQVLKSPSKHPKLKLSRRDQKIKLKDKMSTVMIVNEGKHVTLDKVTSDLQVSSLNEILGYLLQQKKDGKLSSLAKNLGFQLLSDDIDIQSVNTQQSQSEVRANEMPIETSQADSADLNLDHDQHLLSTSAGELKENSKSSELSFQQDEVKTTHIDTTEQIGSHESEESVANHEFTDASMRVKTESSSNRYNFGEEQSPGFGFNVSFFYSDGNYQLLQTLAGGCQIPSLVIVDPFQQQHYVLPAVKILDSYSFHGFISGFLNGSLHPYQRSKDILQGPKEAIHPPFINLDFHEVDPIPQITAHTFSEVVFGHNESGNENVFHAWNNDVLVLFSNSWCGFCQRMELVVRDVYRAIKSNFDVSKSGSRSSKAISDRENLDFVTEKVPMIYLLDCTLNDCDLILKSVNQREVYPSLILFPAKTKKPLLYEGDITVVDIIKFMSQHGNNLHHLTEKAVLRLSNKGGRNQNMFKYTLQIDDHEKSLHGNIKSHETHGQDSELDPVVRSSQIRLSLPPNGLHETLPPVKVGSVLVATRNLLGLQPFDGSKILIVAADQITGIQGLITNKHMAWRSLGDMQEGLDILKRAPLSFGGPVMQTGMPLVALARSACSRNSLPEILPGIRFLDQLATVNKIEELKSANESVVDHWFFLGYSSWDWNQLLGEIARGDWKLSDDGMEQLIWP